MKQKKETEKKQYSFIDTITLQAIICVSIAVVVLLLNLCFPKIGETIQNTCRPYKAVDADAWPAIFTWLEKTIHNIANLRPLSKGFKQQGAGGEPNPFGPYNKVMPPPDHATFAPVVFSGTITPPIEGSVTSYFGYRYHPITGELDFHKGIDIAAPFGTPIAAIISGTIEKVGENASAGKYIILSHGNGLKTTYMHCSSILAKEKAVVREGEIVAKVGSTGMSTGNHLHLQMSQNGTVFDPAWIIDYSGDSAAQVSLALLSGVS